MMKGRIPPPPPPPGSAKPQAVATVPPPPLSLPLPPPLPGPRSTRQRRSVWLLGSVLAAAVLAAVCWVGYYAASARSSPELDDAPEASLYASDPGLQVTAEFCVAELPASSAVGITPVLKKEPIRAELLRPALRLRRRAHIRRHHRLDQKKEYKEKKQAKKATIVVVASKK
jgi:hypothetical protein